MENNMIIFLGVLLLSAIFIEGTITTLPILLVFFLLLAIHRRDALVFVLAFFAGILLDILRLQAVGETSLFLLGFLFLVLLYERKYEIDSLQFVLIASFVGSIGFLISFEFKEILLQAMVGSALGVSLFSIRRVMNKTIE